MARMMYAARVQWLAYWRRAMRSGDANSWGLALALLLAVFVAPQFWRWLIKAKLELSANDATTFELLLSGVSLAWLYLLLSGTSGSIKPCALKHLPFNRKELFALYWSAVLVSPLAWLIVLCSAGLSWAISDAANPLRCAIEILCAASVVIAVSWLLFRREIGGASGAATKRGGRLRMFGNGKLSGLVTKDARYFRRLLDVYAGCAVSLAVGFYLMTSDVLKVEAVCVALVAIFLCNISLAFNSFGFETRAGVERYKLFPLRGAEIIRSKNLAYAAVLALQTAWLVPLVWWKLGASEAAICLFEIVSLVCAFMAWGNITSVTRPYQMTFYRFSSGGAPLDAISGAVFASLPGLAFIALLRDENYLLSKAMLLAALCVVIYLGSVVWAGKIFDRNKGS